MSGKPYVLVVDDSADYRRIITRVLGSAGYESTALSGALEARALLSARLPDAVILDWNMPGESGVELARWMRGETQFASLPLLMVSVNAAPADQARGLREGGLSAYLVKPFEPAELLARLAALLARRAGRRA